MGVTLMFMLLATLTPFIFYQLNKRTLALMQTGLVAGMWVYFSQVMFAAAPEALSVTWLMFYSSLVVAEVAWVMFIIRMVNAKGTYRRRYQ